MIQMDTLTIRKSSDGINARLEMKNGNTVHINCDEIKQDNMFYIFLNSITENKTMIRKTKNLEISCDCTIEKIVYTS